ncbi:phage tail tape measure protein [Aestuariivirga litoralis]|uniref:phage tail tape measure protein n=1 Tax=Aestuariivirga litoralis TaxID=2650924 RepID=UPI0018C680F0|nr:phage tail tape measure protein [Aestuariivirga litoralis]MBG1232972.1 phage tail tape measure protein [Aestuariivirga litoralis]
MATVNSNVQFAISARDQASQAFHAVRNSMERVNDSYEGMKRLAETAFAGFSLAMVVEQFNAVNEKIAQMGDDAQKIGMPVEALSKLRFAADMTSTSFDTLLSGMSHFDKGLSQAAAGGGGDMQRALKAMGISITDANGKVKSQIDILKETSDAFARHRDDENKTALSAAIFGKAVGPDLVPFLNMGSQALERYFAEAEKLNAVVGEDSVQASERYNQGIVRMQTALFGLEKQLVMQTAPAISSATDALTEMLVKIEESPTKIGKMQAAFDGLQKSGIMSWYNYAITLGNQPMADAIGRFQNALVHPQATATSAYNWMNGITESNSEGKGDLPATVKTVTPPQAPLRPSFSAFSPGGAARQQIDEAQKLIDKLRVMNTEFTRGHLQMEIDNNLRQAGTRATAAQRQQITALTIEHARLAAQEQTTLQIAKNAEQAREAMIGSLENVAEMGLDVFDRIAIKGENAIDVARDLEAQLAKAALQAMFLGQGPLAGLFGSSISGGLFGSLFSAPGLYASGGEIGAGQWGVVGEGGGMDHAELVKGPATVIPLNRMGGGDSGSGPNVTFNINAPGADQAAIAQLRRAMTDLVKNLPKTIITTNQRERAASPGY